jgi:parallel beta-helix repeat protein
MKKLLGIVMILILIIPSSIILPAVETPNKTIYVDDDNTEGPWDGSMEHPFQYIQDAIDAARNDYHVKVYNGTYFEHILIDKSVQLSGENTINTTINGGGIKKDIINVSADNVTISGFTLITCMSRSAIHLFNSTNGTIQHNIFVNNNAFQIMFTGVSVISCKNLVIHSNIFTCVDGIDARTSDDIIISNNQFGGCRTGIFLKDCSNYKIRRNSFLKDSIDIEYRYCSNIQITENNFFGLNQKYTDYWVQFGSHNIWDTNFWGWLHPLPKALSGSLILNPDDFWPTHILWITFDWHPSQEPYDIS